MSELDKYLQPLATEAGDRLTDRVARFIELAQQDVYASIVLRQREAASTADHATRSLAYMASKAGYFTRMCEFEHAVFADVEDSNPLLTVGLSSNYQRKLFGSDWFATVCGTAAALMNAARSTPYDADVAELLDPPGFGIDAHASIATWMIGGLRASPEASRMAVTSPSQAVTDDELFDCFLYGYYLRACERALPDEARREFARRERSHDTEQ
jgi:hypothetical protein